MGVPLHSMTRSAECVKIKRRFRDACFTKAKLLPFPMLKIKA